MFNDMMSSILTLLKLKKDTQKTDLEIEKLEREKISEESLLKLASLEEIEKYDDRVRSLHSRIENDIVSSPIPESNNHLKRDITSTVGPIIFIVALVILGALWAIFALFD